MAPPTISGIFRAASTVPVPKRIIAPAIIAMTMGIGNHRMIRPTRPVSPRTSTRTPAMMKLPTISSKGKLPMAPASMAAPGME